MPTKSPRSVLFEGLYYIFAWREDGSTPYPGYVYIGRKNVADEIVTPDPPPAKFPQIVVYPEGTALRSDGWVVVVGTREWTGIHNHRLAFDQAAEQAARLLGG